MTSVRVFFGQVFSARVPGRLGAFLLLSLLLTACATLTDPESAQESSQETIAVVGEGESFQQTFLSRRAGLNGITLWLAPEVENGESRLAVELFPAEEERPAGQGEAPLFTSHLTVKSRGPLSISLPPRTEPPHQSYRLVLRPTGSPLQILGRKGNVYPGGQAYVGGEPIEADLAFRTTYRYQFQSIFEDLRRFAGLAWLALPLGLAFFAPGWLLLDLAGLRRRFDPGSQAALALGLSLALLPLVMLWTTWAGLRWTREGALFGLGGLCAVIAWRILQPALEVKLRLGGSTPARAPVSAAVYPPVEQEASNVTDSKVIANEVVANEVIANEVSANVVITNDVIARERPSRPKQSPTLAPMLQADGKSTLALLAVFLLALALRLAMVRDLATPAWVDSVHHALITRLVQEAGGFPATYAPYLNLLPTHYHAGFHSSLAVFAWIAGLEIPEALLLAGQVLNALAVVAVYLLSASLLENRWAGVLAALITGLITPMPAYYTSWGRYTQLAGLLILPAVLALVKIAFERPPAISGALGEETGAQPARPSRAPRAALALAAIAAAGLVLVHYRVAAFLAVLLAVYLLVHGLGEIFRRSSGWREITGRILLLGAVLGGGAFLLSLPWVWPNLTRLLPTLTPPGGGTPPRLFADFSWRHLNAALGRYATILAGVGLAWGALQRQRFAWVLALWVAGMFFLANFAALGLPGGALVNNTSVAIATFMPVSVAAGYVLSQFFSVWDAVLPGRWRRLYRAGIAAAVTAAALLGARQLLPILNPTTFLFRQGDRAALAWLKENVPAEETVLINPFLWGYGVYAGNDGGFWISVLAGQRTAPPPVIYGFGSQEERQAVQAFCQQVIEQGANPEALVDLLQAQGIRYLYLGVRGGPLAPAALAASPRFRLLYHQDGAWVFQVKE